jgi:exodeoxyribonuclease VII small subunit
MTEKKQNYQTSMERLNEILENIDRSEVPIDELAEQVTEAAGLLKNCKQILTETESKVQDVLEDLEADFGEDPA